MDAQAGDASTAKLLERLQALASPVRLRLLQELVRPARAADLRVPAERERAGFEPHRFLARATIIQHLESLADAGLVRRVGDQYAVDQQGMVSFLRDVGKLAQLRALIEVDVESTLPSGPVPSRQLPGMPRLVTVTGPEAGQAFGLEGAGPWTIGRAPSSSVALSHDPHVSRTHVLVLRHEGTFAARVVDEAKNAAWIDFQRVEPGASSPLRSGSILFIGVTTLVLQA